VPSTSKKQHNFMAAIANNPAFAKKVGIPQSVGKDFTTADKGRKFSKGGDMATKMNPGFMAMIAKKKGMQEGSKADMASDKKQMMGMKKGGMKKMAEGGMTGMMQGAVNKHEGRLHKGATMTKLANGGSFRASANGIAQQGKTKGTQIKMNKGGMSC